MREAQSRRTNTPTPTLMPTAIVVVWGLEEDVVFSVRVLPVSVEVGFITLPLPLEVRVEYVVLMVEGTRVVEMAVVSGVEAVDSVVEVARVVGAVDCCVALEVVEVDSIDSEDVVEDVDVDEDVVDVVEDVATVAARLEDGVEVTEITVLDVCRVELWVVESAV